MGRMRWVHKPKKCFTRIEKMMTAEQLIAEGERLSRPCIYLRPFSDGRETAGIWGGTGIVPVLDDSYRHWLTLSSNILPDGFGDLSGCLSVYVAEDAENGTVAVDETASLPTDMTEGTLLFGYTGISYPPIDAVFRFGSPNVHEWLQSNGWQLDWPYNSNFKGREVVEAYENYIQRRNPLFAPDSMGGIYAMVGGWHEPWPEGDWEDLLRNRLLLFTYQDAEPFIEVWRDESGSFQVIQRIT
jgi:hypothetical protein